MPTKSKKQPDLLENSSVSQINSNQEEYVRLLQTGTKDPSLSYEQISQNIQQNPEIGLHYDREVLKQAASELFQSHLNKLETINEIIAESPYVKNHLSPEQKTQHQADIRSYYQAEFDKKTNPQLEPTKAHQIAQNNNQANNVEPELKQLNQKSNREAEDYALGLVQSLDQRRLNVDRLQIDVNGKTVFKMRDGDIEPHKTAISNEHTELIKKALNDPASLKGSVKITQGNQVLLHVKDGRVLIDSAGLSKQSAKIDVKTPDAPSQELYERHSKDVKSNGLQATTEIAASALKEGNSETQVMEMLKAHDSGFQKLASTQGEESANRTLQKIVATTKGKLTSQQKPPQQSEEINKAKSLSR
jgi:hypothetical protein